MAHTQYRKEVIKVNGRDIEIFKINHDVNGNPRYVIHYLSVIPDFDYSMFEPGTYVNNGYNEAVRRIKKIGGRKYTAKWYGGGLVFSSYSVEDDLATVVPPAN